MLAPLFAGSARQGSRPATRRGSGIPPAEDQAAARPASSGTKSYLQPVSFIRSAGVAESGFDWGYVPAK